MHHLIASVMIIGILVGVIFVPVFGQEEQKAKDLEKTTDKYNPCGPGYALIGDICDRVPEGYVETRTPCEISAASIAAAGGVTKDYSVELAKCEEEMMKESMMDKNQIMEKDMMEQKETTKEKPEEKGGGCLIATAAYGTELAPQVQLLREIRDNTIMSTLSGMTFMAGFNQLYYSFSPYIADMERENPAFQEVVRAFITPMISTLSIMTLAQDGSEIQVFGLGISVIALNLGMYIVAPALVAFKINQHIKLRK